MTPAEAAREARELSTISLFYRVALEAHAREHAQKRRREMAQFLAAGAAVAGWLATYYADRALWFSATEGVA